MLKFLIHVFNFAEVYAVALTWIVVPLLFVAAYQWLRKGGLFPILEKGKPAADPKVKEADSAH